MSSSEVDHRNLAFSIVGMVESADGNVDDKSVDSERRKSVENLVLSSQDAIGQSISQALTFSGVITNHATNICAQDKPVSRSPSPCRHSAEPSDNADIEKYDTNGLSAPNADTISVSSAECGARGGGDKGSSPSARAGDLPRAKKKSWYSGLYPTYKSRSDDFKRLFKDLPDEERLIVDYSCALQKDILAHGRLYVSQNYLCFYANIFGWETNMALKWKDVTAITKEKTALVIPNAILVCTETEKHFLASFGGRDKAYLMLFRVWQNALMGQQMSSQEMWQWVHRCYGEELGFNSDDEEDGKTREGEKLSTARLSVESIPEDFLESSIDGAMAMAGGEMKPLGTVSLAGGGTGRLERGEGARRPHYQRSVSQSPPTRTSLLVNGEGFGENGGEPIPTDMSDSSDSDHNKNNGEGGVLGCGEGHDGRLQLETDVPINIDQLFTMLFTSSKFNLELMASRNTSDYIQSEWKQDSETGLKCRQATYTLAMNQSIGPKCVHVTETQKMNKWCKPGQQYSIEASCENGGVPYADSFYVVVHYCLRRRADKLTHMHAYSHIKYKKSVWALVKGFIEKNTWSGLDDYFKLLKEKLAAESEGGAPSKRKQRRRRRVSSCGEGVAGVGGASGAGVGVAGAALEAGLVTSRHSRYVLPALLLLLAINALLYWRLYHAPHFYPPYRSTEGMSVEQRSAWARLVEQHSRSHQDQLLLWRDALHTAIDTLRQTEHALSDLLEAIKPSLEKAQADAAADNIPKPDL